MKFCILPSNWKQTFIYNGKIKIKFSIYVFVKVVENIFFFEKTA